METETDIRDRDIFGRRILKNMQSNEQSGISQGANATAEDEDDGWGSMIRTASTPGEARLNNPDCATFPASRLGSGGGDQSQRWGRDRSKRGDGSKGGRGGRRRGGRFGNSNRERNDGNSNKPQPLNFSRLCDHLSLTPDGTIMALGKELEVWEKFVNSEEVKINKNSLMVAIQILANKVCCESVMTSQQLAILAATNSENFITAIKEKCEWTRENIEANLPDDSKQLCIFSRSGFVQLDRSAETFFRNVLVYCGYIVSRLSDKVTIDFLRPVVVSSLETVTLMESKDDTDSDLRKDFKLLLEKLDSVVLEQKAKLQEVMAPEDEVPNDYRDMPIVPTIKELLSDEEVFLRPNKTSGAYNDSLHYLDVQFRLLRQDFVQPLKLGIQDFLKYSDEYLSNAKRMPFGSIRLYSGVLLKNMALERGVLVHKIQLREGSYEHINWATSKRLLTGCLVVISSDLFRTAYFAVVADREVPEMSSGILSVAWEGVRPPEQRKCEYLMIECEVYFEAFRHTLQILQVLQLDNFPMCKFIVSASSDVDSPRYLKDAKGIMKLRLKSDGYVTINALEGSSWPTEDELGLDDNQFKAFQAGLTKEFAIIQGPPGTGKTFLGLRIAEAFLNNLPNRGINTMGPILVVCYTNHALDQFLEGILKMNGKTSVIRVGGRCKSELLEYFTLSHLFRVSSSGKMSRDYWAARKLIQSGIDDLQEDFSYVLATVNGLTNLQGVINFQSLCIWNVLTKDYPKAVWKCLSNKNWFGLPDKFFESQDFNEELDTKINEWFEVLPCLNKSVIVPDSQTRKRNAQKEEHDMEDDDVNNLLESRITDDIIPGFDRLSIAKTFQLDYIDKLSTDDCEEFLKSSDSILRDIRSRTTTPEIKHQHLLDIQTEIRVVKNRRKLLERIFDLHESKRLELPRVQKLLEKCGSLSEDLAIEELHRISISQRWALYFNVIERALTVCLNKVPELEGKLIHERKRLQECYHYAKGLLLQNAQVVGMTTTGAAKYRELVKMMKSKIVIVEEAAEVLESHIVTCVTRHCEHLILIGDHRQLRPSTVVYELAKKFNLDVSLFERMINNNLNCYPLKVQHRMRPEIANLVLDTIYKELENHPSVSEYPRVPGVNKNLYFISHNRYEDSEMDSMSKSNYFEAKFLAGLCRYLIHQGYAPEQITVLTTYTGQMFLLKKTVHSFLECEDVRVTSVDSFQGEENDIILLSLVRSNQDNSIGFMSIDNRICVSLSRARHGLFIIGNMAVLASKSQTWYKIQEKLKARKEIGPSLTLQCQTHGTESIISSEEDFLQQVPSGGCRLRCNTVLDCGHKCEEFCHVTDQDHFYLFKCRMPCEKRCAHDHRCSGLCSDIPCPPCKGFIKKTLPCYHEKLMSCHQDIELVDCTTEVKKELPCGHLDTVSCHLDARQVRCRLVVEKELLCGHRANLQCCEDPVLAACKEFVVKKLSPCGHEQKVGCQFGPCEAKCMTIVKILDKSGQSINMPCYEDTKM